MRRCIAFGVLCLAAVPVHAGELVALKAESFELGGYRGVVYYTNEHDGYQVVATIADGEAGPPIRLVAILAESQAITISVPGEFGTQSQELNISHAGGKLMVSSTVSAGELMGISGQAIDPKGQRCS